MDGQTMKVEGQDASRKGLANTPEDVRSDDRGHRMGFVGKNFCNDTSRGGSDYGWDNGE